MHSCISGVVDFSMLEQFPNDFFLFGASIKQYEHGTGCLSMGANTPVKITWNVKKKTFEKEHHFPNLVFAFHSNFRGCSVSQPCAVEVKRV